MKTLLYVYLLLSPVDTEDYSAASCSIAVKIKGIKTNRGRLLVSLYNSSAGFPADRTTAIQSKSVEAVIPTTEVVFKDLLPGTYAIAAMHDENNNGVMDKNLLGIPTEGYCVSNNAKGLMSAPSFARAKFDVHREVKQELRMTY